MCLKLLGMCSVIFCLCCIDVICLCNFMMYWWYLLVLVNFTSFTVTTCFGNAYAFRVVFVVVSVLCYFVFMWFVLYFKNDFIFIVFFNLSMDFMNVFLFFFGSVTYCTFSSSTLIASIDLSKGLLFLEMCVNVGVGVFVLFNCLIVVMLMFDK